MLSRSFTAFALVVVYVLGGSYGVAGRALAASTPVITPALSVRDYEDTIKRQDDGPDAISLAQILLTAIPVSLRQIAATNIPAVSTILNEEFSGDKRPQWFNELPWDIQEYLIEKFGPATAVPEPGATEPAWSEPVWSEPTENTWWTQPAMTSWSEPLYASSSTPDSTQTTEDPQQSSTTPTSTESTTIASTGSLSTHVTAPTQSTGKPPLAPTADQSEESSHNGGLSKSQKVGIGVGIPFAIIGAAALLLGCCLLLRRHQRKKIDGSLPPSSPGFIPRFAFQEKTADDSEPRQPLNQGGSNSSFGDLANMTWDDDIANYVDTSSSGESVPTINNYPPQTVMAPVLYHTHSSNRARGKRTSYTSLHSVAEVSEPGDMESPVLGRHTSPTSSPSRPSPSKRPIPPSPRVLIPLPVPTATQIKRKPVPTSPTSPTSPTNGAFNPTAALASQSLLRQTMPDHNSPTRSPQAQLGNHTRIFSNSSQTSPYISPIEENSPWNPFSNSNSYEEDYGPGDQHTQQHQRRASNDSYIDIDDGLYGHTSLSRYPDPRPQKSRPDWPLKSHSGHKRNKSPLWDRVYDGSN